MIRTANPRVIPEVTDEMLAEWAQDDRYLRLLRQLGPRSVMIVPLRARDRVLGAMYLLAAESDRCYDGADLTLAEDLAHRAALAIDNARLYAAVQAAEARSQGLFEGTTDALLMVGPDGGIWTPTRPCASSPATPGRSPGMRPRQSVRRRRGGRGRCTGCCSTVSSGKPRRSSFARMARGCPWSSEASRSSRTMGPCVCCPPAISRSAAPWSNCSRTFWPW